MVRYCLPRLDEVPRLPTAIAGPNPRKKILYKHKIILPAVRSRRLVVQDVWFSSRKSRVRLPPGSPRKESQPTAGAFFLVRPARESNGHASGMPRALAPKRERRGGCSQHISCLASQATPAGAQIQALLDGVVYNCSHE